MAVRVTCDLCGDPVEKLFPNNITVISGNGEMLFKKYNVLITFVRPDTKDRINVDICSECLKKGGIGLGGDD